MMTFRLDVGRVTGAPVVASGSHATNAPILQKGESIFIFAQYFDLYSPKRITSIEFSCEMASGLQVLHIFPFVEYQQKNRYSFPMKGKFAILGHPKEIFGHRTKAWEEFGIDIQVLGPREQTYSSNPKKVRDHYCFGAKVYSPGDGIVARVADGLEDNPVPYSPKDIDKHIKQVGLQFPVLQREGGNMIIIDHGNGEFSNLAHLKRGSITVKQGEHVKRDQPIALCGNSGAGSTAPHLHFHFTNGSDYATAPSLPIVFDNVESILFSDQVIQSIELPPEFSPVVRDSGIILWKTTSKQTCHWVQKAAHEYLLLIFF